MYHSGVYIFRFLQRLTVSYKFSLKQWIRVNILPLEGFADICQDPFSTIVMTFLYCPCSLFFVEYTFMYSQTKRYHSHHKSAGLEPEFVKCTACVAACNRFLTDKPPWNNVQVTDITIIVLIQGKKSPHPSYVEYNGKVNLIFAYS